MHLSPGCATTYRDLIADQIGIQIIAYALANFQSVSKFQLVAVSSLDTAAHPLEVSLSGSRGHRIAHARLKKLCLLLLRQQVAWKKAM